MTNFPYNRDIPESTNNPSVDQPDMKINTNSTDDLINVDHVSFGFDDGGFHKVIHQITQGSDPASIVGVNQVYSKSYIPDTTGGVPDTQLFARTGLGGVSQLTGNFATTEGWQWIGGVLVQWGQVIQSLTTITSGTVTFKDRVVGAIPFPTNCFVVTTTPFHSNATPPLVPMTVSIRLSTLSNLQFSWRAIQTTAIPYVGFQWIAIGN